MGKSTVDLHTVERMLREIRPQKKQRPGCGAFDATVVFLLFFNPDNPHILAVLKSDTEGYPWRNQVALPGGHVDPGDVSALDAAFRELKEEVHIHREEVRFIGTLGHFQTINNKNIEVFLGIWNGRRSLRFDKAEIARILQIPVSTLVQIHAARGYHGRNPGVHELVYPVEDVRIGGVTGKIIHFLLERLYPVFAQEESAAAETPENQGGLD